MKRKGIALLMIMTLALSSMTGCGEKEQTQGTDNNNEQNVQTQEVPPQMQPGGDQMQEALTEKVAEYTFDEIFSDRDMKQTADVKDAVFVTLSDDLVITEEGVYVLSGSLTEGQIVIECEDTEKVQLVLDGVDIANTGSAAIYVKEADKVFITTTAGSVNTLSVTGEMQADGDTNVDGVVFSRADLTINGEGTLNIVSGEEHAIVGKDDVVVTGSEITIDAKGDGIQANDLVAIAGGNIRIENCEEGLESTVIAIHGGETTIVATDDGINATDMNGKSETTETEEDEQGFFGGKGGGNMFATDGVSMICVFDGIVKVTADGDGIDSNGEFYVGGGEVYVAGSENGGNGALDYAGTGQIDGGICIATGMSQMAMNFGSVSTQASVMTTLDETVSDEVVVKNASGEVIASFTPGRSYNNVVISCKEIAVGDTVTFETGNVSKQVEVTDMITGGQGGFGGPGGFGGHGNRGNRGEWTEGENPQMPEGMEPPVGEMPQMPEGMERPTGERPEMPQGM